MYSSYYLFFEFIYNNKHHSFFEKSIDECSLLLVLFPHNEWLKFSVTRRKFIKHLKFWHASEGLYLRV